MVGQGDKIRYWPIYRLLLPQNYVGETGWLVVVNNVNNKMFLSTSVLKNKRDSEPKWRMCRKNKIIATTEPKPKVTFFINASPSPNSQSPKKNAGLKI